LNSTFQKQFKRFRQIAKVAKKIRRPAVADSAAAASKKPLTGVSG
jgi:hypothetical protein